MKGDEHMKRAIILTGFLVVLLVAVLAYAQGPGMMGGGQGWNYCPYCGQNLGQGGGYGMMGPGMMGGGYGMGRGMMGGGYGMGPGMMGGGYGMGPGMMGGGYGMGPGMMGGGYGMGPGYSQQNEACQKFFDDTAAMRKDLNTKRYEYFETIRNPKTTPETVAKLEKELRELQEKIYAKAPQGCW
jgi:hypothetical protein